MMNKQVCVVVDAFSTGRYLAKEFLSRGYRSLHVQSTPKITSELLRNFDPSDFIENIQHGSDFDSTLSEIQRYDVACVIAGTESGVELADWLSESLNLPTNGSRLTRARRDKFEMKEVLRAKGVRTAEYAKAAHASQIVDWAREKRIPKVVLKPVNSAGTDNVHICESELEIRKAFGRIIGQENRLGFVNEEVLAEEYLSGVEHVVNTVSRDKVHYIAEIWRCKKRQVKGASAHACIYDMAKMLPFDGDDQSKLVEYTRRVLDALEISHGPAHAELMMTSEGPVLIEIAARLMGSVNPLAIDECLGTNPVRLTVDAYLNQSNFKRACEAPYSLRKNIYGVSLISNVEGVLEAIPLLEQIEQLESFFSIRLSVEKGARIERTADFFTSPGGVYLIHPDLNVLDRDYEAIRRLEVNGYILKSNEIIV